MVIFKLVNGRYKAEVELINGSSMKVFIDTGSPLSVISYTDLLKMTGYGNYILDFIRNTKGIKMRGFIGGCTEMIPIRLRNCSVDGIYFSDLFFLLNTDIKQKESLFGLDFITAFGSMSGNYNNPIIMDNPSVEFYKNNFISFCGTDVIYEISTLEKENNISEL